MQELNPYIDDGYYPRIKQLSEYDQNDIDKLLVEE